MGRQQSYIEFPVALLQGIPDRPTEEQRKQWCQMAVKWTVYHLAISLLRKAKTLPYERLHEIEQKTGLQDDHPDFYPAWACVILGCPLTITGREAVRVHNQCMDRFAIEQGRKLCRIRVDILASAASGALSWSQFRILVALYATLNHKAAAVRVHRGQLAAMASGYGSEKYLPPDLPDLLRPHQVSYRIRALEQRGLILSWMAGDRRSLYVSNSMDYSEFSRWMVSRETARLERRSRQPTAKEKAALLKQETAVVMGPTKAARVGLRETILTPDQQERLMQAMETGRRRISARD